jgi:hypothetical protein
MEWKNNIPKGTMKIRSLNDCLHAKYPGKGEYIYCAKGHKLGNGKVLKSRVDKGVKLIFKCCQLCTYFENMDDLTSPVK